jgi:hypothetical protein
MRMVGFEELLTYFLFFLFAAIVADPLSAKGNASIVDRGFAKLPRTKTPSRCGVSMLQQSYRSVGTYKLRQYQLKWKYACSVLSIYVVSS